MLLDVCCLLFLILALYKGITRGFIRALLSLVAFTIGWILATIFSGKVSVYLQNHGMKDKTWLPLLSFVIILVATFILIYLIGKALDRMTEMIMIGWLNKLSGVLLYLLLYTVMISSLVYFMEKIHLLEKKDTEKSLTYPYISKWAPVILEKTGEIIPYLKQIPETLNPEKNEETDK